MTDQQQPQQAPQQTTPQPTIQQPNFYHGSGQLPPQAPQQPQQPAPQQPQQPAPMAQAFTPSYVSFNTTAPQPQQPPQPPAPPANPYQAIIDQQKAQIDALMNQNTALSGQINQMVQNGYQVNTQLQQMQPQQVQQVQQPQQVGQNWAYQPQAQFAPVYMPEDAPMLLNQDVSLEGLAKEIGKKEQSGD